MTGVRPRRAAPHARFLPHHRSPRPLRGSPGPRPALGHRRRGQPGDRRRRRRPRAPRRGAPRPPPAGGDPRRRCPPEPRAVRDLSRRHPDTRLVLFTGTRRRPNARRCSPSARAPASDGTPKRATSSARSTSPRAGFNSFPAGRRRAGGALTSGVASADSARGRARHDAPARQLQRRDRQALQVGVETVRTHARNIYRKLGVTSRLELAQASPRPPAPDIEVPAAPHPAAPACRPRPARTASPRSADR